MRQSVYCVAAEMAADQGADLLVNTEGGALAGAMRFEAAAPTIVMPELESLMCNWPRCS
jgi:hypothetical protein